MVFNLIPKRQKTTPKRTINIDPVSVASLSSNQWITAWKTLTLEIRTGAFLGKALPGAVGEHMAPGPKDPLSTESYPVTLW